MTSMTNPSTSRVDRGKLLTAALASVAAAVVANVILYFLARALFDLTEGFMPLSVGPIALLTAAGTGLGALVYAWLARRSATPARTYTRVAAVAAVLSIIPNVLGALRPAMFALPVGAAGTSSDFLVLILFHIVAAVVSVWVLLRLAR